MSQGWTDDVSEVLASEAQIRQRVGELGAAISLDYAGQRPVLVGVLKGVCLFMADLLRVVTIPVEIDFMAISSYRSAATSPAVRLLKDLEINIEGRHVLFVEDMVDTGLTLNYLLRNLRERQPASVQVCALFDKARLRLVDLPLRYVGFSLPDRFVVGYGLDYHQRYRNLPFVGTLSASVLLPGAAPSG